MFDNRSDSDPDASTAGEWYGYAIIRVVPHVERDEFLNVGAILFARTKGFLEARLELDEARLRAMAPDGDLARIKRHLAAIVAISAGEPNAGPIAAQPRSERFHWLTAARSTVIQTSSIHVGRCDDPSRELDELLDRFVRPPPRGRGNE